MNISPLAVVHPGVQIGQSVTTGPLTVIEKDVVIGDNCHIYSHVVILDSIRIDKNCDIFPGVIVIGVPQDMRLAREITTAEIGDNTTLRECVTVNRGTASKGKIVVGRNCLVMAYSHMTRDYVLKDHIIIGNASRITGEVGIDDFAIVSRSSSVHQFTRTPKHVMVQDGSRIRKDIPPYTLVGYDPIAHCGTNIIGLRRRGFINQQVFLVQNTYRTLYTRGLNNMEALEVIEAEYESSEERDLALSFVKSSGRSIVGDSVGE